MKRLISVFVFSATLILAVGSVEAQTPGQVPVFDQPGTGACNNAGGNDCIDSVITQDANGNIGIGTTAPTAKLHVAAGNVNIENSTGTSGSILKGGVVFIHDFGGANASNTFIGRNAGAALFFNGGGTYNTGSGAFALQSNTTGTFNNAFGAFALQSNTTGNVNTASGVNTLLNNTTGFNNTAGGGGALQSNTTGDNNTASGVDALHSNTTGIHNTASGVDALYYNNGSYNTAIGFYALGSNTTGTDNTAIGVNALVSNTTGGSNTASGVNALVNNTGSLNTASGWGALFDNTTGSFNAAGGYDALYHNTTGSGNTAVGPFADVASGDLSNATAIGYNAVVNASNKIRLGNTQVSIVEGPPYSTVSDKNAKENFQPVDAEQVLQKIRAMNVTSWNYIGQDPTQFRHYGPVAQDFFAAFGNDGVGTIGSPTTITSTDMNGVLMLAIKALGKENETFKAENAELKARIEALERLAK